MMVRVRRNEIKPVLFNAVSLAFLVLLLVKGIVGAFFQGNVDQHGSSRIVQVSAHHKAINQ